MKSNRAKHVPNWCGGCCSGRTSNIKKQKEPCPCLKIVPAGFPAQPIMIRKHNCSMSAKPWGFWSADTRLRFTRTKLKSSLMSLQKIYDFLSEKILPQSVGWLPEKWHAQKKTKWWNSSVLKTLRKFMKPYFFPKPTKNFVICSAIPVLIF